MPSSNNLVKSTIKVVTPLPAGVINTFMAPLNLINVGLTLGRKFRIYSQPSNLAPLFAGSVLDCVAGRNPTMQQVSRVIFGSASILKCSEDLLRLAEEIQKISAIFRGRSYVFIKHKSWTEFTPSVRYFIKLEYIENKILVQRFNNCVKEAFKNLFLLALHFSDACMAFRENTVSEVFVHGKDLLQKISDPDATVVKNLNRLNKISDKMLSGLNLSWTTKALVGVCTVPAKIRQKVGFEEMFRNCKDNFVDVGEKLLAAGEALHWGIAEGLCRVHLIKFVPKELRPEGPRNYEFYAEGQSPDDLRFVDPALRIPIKYKRSRSSHLVPE